jgi:predicted transcriptional regulator
LSNWWRTLLGTVLRPKQRKKATARFRPEKYFEIGVDAIVSRAYSFFNMSSAAISQWEALRARLVRATARRGVKASLAIELGVSHAAVSQWASGDCCPSAELTLRLLKWVSEAESKKQNVPGRGTNTSKGLTRQLNQVNENKSTRPVKR